MAGTYEIAKANGGVLRITTGDVCFQVNNDQSERFFPFQSIPGGTCVNLRLDCQRPVDLGETFISEDTWGYINEQCERYYASGIKIVDECMHTGGRQPARALRNKIISLLPKYDHEQLVLDFENVTSVSSSFLDELLGRLAVTLGKNEFTKRIHLINASNAIIDMANVVLHQRIQNEDVVW